MPRPILFTIRAGIPRACPACPVEVHDRFYHAGSPGPRGRLVPYRRVGNAAGHVTHRQHEGGDGFRLRRQANVPAVDAQVAGPVQIAALEEQIVAVKNQAVAGDVQHALAIRRPVARRVADRVTADVTQKAHRHAAGIQAIGQTAHAIGPQAVAQQHDAGARVLGVNPANVLAESGPAANLPEVGVAKTQFLQLGREAIQVPQAQRIQTVDDEDMDTVAFPLGNLLALFLQKGGALQGMGKTQTGKQGRRSGLDHFRRECFGGLGRRKNGTTRQRHKAGKTTTPEGHRLTRDRSLGLGLPSRDMSFLYPSRIPRRLH